MRRFNESESKYLAQGDLKDIGKDAIGVDATIIGFDIIEFKKDSGTEEERAINFRELPKPMILNVTNEGMLCEIHGDPKNTTEDGLEDHFRGKQVNVYVDPNVMFGRKKVGGLRLRAVQAMPEVTSPTSDEPPPLTDDQIPF